MSWRSRESRVADPLGGPVLDVVLELVDLVVELVDQVEEALGDVVDEVVDDHRDVLGVAAGGLRRVRFATAAGPHPATCAR